jgi:2'-5' RNA ligase
MFDNIPGQLRNLFGNPGNTPPAPDPLTTKPPANKPPRGASGRAHFNGFIQWDELNPKWIGNNGLKLADLMWRTDPDIKRNMMAVWSPIQAATWAVEPFGGDKASDKDKYAAELGEHVLWEYMRPNFVEHLAELGPILLRSGFCDFEQIWKTTTFRGKTIIAPRKLGLRLPRSVWKFYQDDDGELTGIVQFLPNASNVWIPSEELLHYRIQAEGDNWTGTSLLRQAYKPWYYKEHLERIMAIGEERKAIGVPFVYPPTAADEETKEEVEIILANLHVNEVGFAMMPGPKAGPNVDLGVGWEVEVVQFDSSSGNTIKDAIELHTLKIAGAFLADFLELGHHQVGARATAEVQEDPFLTSVKALGDLVTLPLNDLLARIAYLNIPGLEGAPKLNMTLHDEASLSELSAYAAQLQLGGFMAADPQLEDYFRERADFPAVDPEVRAEREAARKAGMEAAAQAAQQPESAHEQETGEGPGGTTTKLAGGKDPAPDEPAPGKKTDPQKTNNGPAKPTKETLTLDAAASEPDGVMVALYPPPDVAAKLALKGGQDPRTMHVTLAYLGKTGDLQDADRLKGVIAGWAATTPPVSGKTAGLGVFAPSSTSDGQPVTYASVDAQGLDHHRGSLVHMLKHAGFPVAHDHGFTPHMTLAYADRRDTKLPEQALRFGHATLAIGGEQHHFPLTGIPRVTLDAADGDPVGSAPWYEKLLSQGKLREALDGARESMQTAVAPQVVKFATQVAARGRSGRKMTVVPPAELVSAIQVELERLYDIGYTTVADELAKQHQANGTTPLLTSPPVRTLDAEPESEEEDETPVGKRRKRARRRATIAAQHIANETAREVEKGAVAGERHPLTLQRRAEAAATGALRKEALTNASPSINDGRRDAALAAAGVLVLRQGKESETEAGTPGSLAGLEMHGIYTAVLDERTCDPCQIADDGVPRELEDPALEVPNPQCAGGEYCRCAVVFVLVGTEGPGAAIEAISE